MTLFDSIAARDEGIARVEENNGTWLERMRGKARNLARHNGQVNIDELRQWSAYLEADHGIVARHPNAWGAIFKSDEWEQTGTYQASTRISSHARRIWNWRLK